LKVAVKQTACDKAEIARIGTHKVWKLTNKPVILYKAGMSVDADGAPKAYHPDNRSGLDHIGNAGKPGNWWALVTDNGKASGKPVVQGPQDPAPGFYVSATALVNPTVQNPKNPKRYVNSEEIPYIVLPPPVRKAASAKLGDFALVINTSNNKQCYAIFADIGPADHLGEGSIKLADALGIPKSPRNGGTNKNELIYVVFAGSGNGKPRTVQEINQEGEKLLSNAGSLATLRACQL
jgi:hypothetical protein